MSERDVEECRKGGEYSEDEKTKGRKEEVVTELKPSCNYVVTRLILLTQSSHDLYVI